MEVVSSARMSVLPSASDVPRVTAPPPRDSVKTDLPAQASVQQTPASHEPGRDRAGSTPNTSSDVARDVTIDPKTQEVVFQAINSKSGEIIRQVPDKALLRIRAYSREQREAEAEAESERHVSRIA